MQNYSLLERVGDLGKPVLLKRGLSATINELLMAAEYILSRGNTAWRCASEASAPFETSTRNTLDINAVPVRAIAAALGRPLGDARARAVDAA